MSGSQITSLAGVLFILAAIIWFFAGTTDSTIAIVFLVLGIIFLGSSAVRRGNGTTPPPAA